MRAEQFISDQKYAEMEGRAARQWMYERNGVDERPEPKSVTSTVEQPDATIPTPIGEQPKQTLSETGQIANYGTVWTAGEAKIVF